MIFIIEMPYKFIFITDPTESETQQIRTLYDKADWWEPNDDGRPDLIRRIVSGSHCFLTVKDKADIIGMGRAISDGINDAYLQDITMLPSFRHRGVGTMLVQTLIERLHHDGLRWIGLIASSHSHPFYQKLGFIEMPFSMPMLLKDSSKI
jgi:spermidine synthase